MADTSPELTDVEEDTERSFLGVPEAFDLLLVQKMAT
jgi:hypothetical protein